jgi:hypothetical protein
MSLEMRKNEHGIIAVRMITDIVFLDNSTVRNIKNDIFDTRWGAATNAALKYAKDIYVSGDRLEIIELPHVPVGNKESTLEQLRGEAQ